MSKKTFYINSYGGSGSCMLRRYLEQFGKCTHVHERRRILKLRSKRVMPKLKTHNLAGPLVNTSQVVVVFVWTDPVYATYSRFGNPRHHNNVASPRPKATIQNMVDAKRDLHDLAGFVRNWTTPANRNYKLVVVRYRALFTTAGLTKLHKMLGIKAPIRKIIKKETKRPMPGKAALEIAFADLKRRLEAHPDIFVVPRN